MISKRLQYCWFFKRNGIRHAWVFEKFETKIHSAKVCRENNAQKSQNGEPKAVPKNTN
jgi:hypothetical protein